jgi:hypothetical protein
MSAMPKAVQITLYEQNDPRQPQVRTEFDETIEPKFDENIEYVEIENFDLVATAAPGTKLYAWISYDLNGTAGEIYATPQEAAKALETYINGNWYAETIEAEGFDKTLDETIKRFLADPETPAFFHTDFRIIDDTIYVGMEDQPTGLSVLVKA